MPRTTRAPDHITRRALLQGLGSTLGSAPLLFHPFQLRASSLLNAAAAEPTFHAALPLTLAEAPFTPHYPARSPLEDVLRMVEPGSDQYISEKYAVEIAAVLERWRTSFQAGDLSVLSASMLPSLQASSLQPAQETDLRAGSPISGLHRVFAPSLAPGKERFLANLRAWLGTAAHVEKVDFEITSIEQTSADPVTVRARLRYDLTLAAGPAREQRVGTWVMAWQREDAADTPGSWKLSRLEAQAETITRARGPVFLDVTQEALGANASYADQMLRGSDAWRTMLDGACGIDIYGNNGIAAGDFDNDGFDDLYVSQPAGLPNRLYRNRGDGTFEDVTEKAGVGVLDNTACALFADFRNLGLQDLLVVCGSGPLLFLNQGNGTFARKPDAFHFARTPQGTFTHAALADYDHDGKLDIYFCLYSYYLGLDQYHYPIPYFDARNGPPNFLLHNQGDGTFVDTTEAAGLNADNDRYSFAAAWGESSPGHGPDLYVANDFGRNSFYRRRDDGTFHSAATEAHVEDVGAGMSASWADINNDGHPDLYVANMWSAAGQRVAQQPLFHTRTSPSIRDLYQRHAEGNVLYRNRDNGVFTNDSQPAGVAMGRWAWSSDFWDFDHDGYPDLYVTNGYISAPAQQAGQAPAQEDTAVQHDLGSFFWRQVVARSPDDSTPSLAYEHGWNALNELIRSDRSWSGYERNVFYANNRDGTFSEVSGVVGLDFLEDGRSFALADIDHDGRLEVILKNRNAPQLRILRNAMPELGDSIAFRLRGTTSNRDAVGAAITLESGTLSQTRYLQAGSGFLAQHAKEVFFGLGNSSGATAGSLRATVRWPGGATQQFTDLPRNHRIWIEEGVATFTAKPFAAPSSGYLQPGPPAAQEALPRTVETWLLDPLKAPEFTLPDQSATPRKLAAYQGSFVLLQFWAGQSPECLSQLSRWQQVHAELSRLDLHVLAINVDRGAEAEQARSLAGHQQYSFPVLFATDEIAGIYNIIYRYLFDRRRDLPLPTSFLLDREGVIVKLYQGPVGVDRVREDIGAIPVTAEARLRKALPFAGTLYQTSFNRNDFTYGVAMYQHGYLEQAEASFQQVVAAKPQDAEGFYNLGTLNLRKNNYAQAQQCLKQALALRANYPEAWNNLGMIAAQQGHAEEAIQNFTQSLALRPAYATALLNLGNVYRRQGNVAQAQQTLERARDLEPDDPEANYSLGMLYIQQDQLQPASEYLTRALDLRPGYPEALNNLGVLFVRQQEYAKAEEQFRTCIRLNPAFEQSYINLARLAVQQQDKGKAVEALKDLLRVEPGSEAAKQGLQVLEAPPAPN